LLTFTTKRHVFLSAEKPSRSIGLFFKRFDFCYHGIVPQKSIAAKSRQFVQHVVPAVIKPARTLWHEVIGFLFFVLAIAAVPTSYKALQRFDGSVASILTVGMCAVFILIMGGYAISSFLRARKISRS
jgi:hypothetical protein